MISLKSSDLENELFKVKRISFQEIRADEADIFEAVILKDTLSVLTENLECVFGKAVCPGNVLSVEVEKKIEPYGGIRGNQVLYFSKRPDFYLFAMLWPWQDGAHITLKVFCA